MRVCLDATIEWLGIISKNCGSVYGLREASLWVGFGVVSQGKSMSMGRWGKGKDKSSEEKPVKLGYFSWSGLNVISFLYHN